VSEQGTNIDHIASLKHEIKNFPFEPGVYLMRDSNGTIIYIGKAKRLRNRVSSYFSKSAPYKVSFILRSLHTISYIVTSNEYEALLLENNLIKKHQPRFNVFLKDGKSYPVIRITAEEYPRVFKTRNIVKDGSDYFGPYPNVDALNKYLEILWKTVPLRRCKKIKPRTSPCLYYHIGRCAAVCAQKITNDEYLARVSMIKKLLRGSSGGYERMLEQKMKEAADGLKFEQAMEYRNALQSIKSLLIEQRIEDFNTACRDYLAYVEEDDKGACVILHMQGGKLDETYQYIVTNSIDDTDDVIMQCIMQHYDGARDVPEYVYTHKKLGNNDMIIQWFQQEHGKKVSIGLPKDGQDARLVHMAINNAWGEIRKVRTDIGTKSDLIVLQEILDLPGPPQVVEGFDIAHIGGKHTVGAMVSVIEGNVDSSKHRLFSLRSIEDGKPNDVASIKECVIRRYTRLKNEQKKLPDLIVIDGGIAQLRAALDGLHILELDIPLVAIAKREERLYTPASKVGIKLREGHPALRVVQKVRDEAHRFATKARARRQHKDVGAGFLLSIPNIGKKRAEKILREFKRLSATLEISPEILAKTLGISTDTAVTMQEKIKEHLNNSSFEGK